MYLQCDFRGVWRDTRVPLVLHCIDLIYRSHLLLLCLLTHLRSSIRCRCIGVSVAVFLHKGLSRCRQELAVLSLLLLMSGLIHLCKMSQMVRGYCLCESSSQVSVSWVERSGKAGEIDQ